LLRGVIVVDIVRELRKKFNILRGGQAIPTLTTAVLLECCVGGVSGLCGEPTQKEMGAFCSDCLKSFSGSSSSTQYETISTDERDMTSGGNTINQTTATTTTTDAYSQQQRNENKNVLLFYH
jgi:hypothetical protein